jgi:predicted outer membrane repeat protein
MILTLLSLNTAHAAIITVGFSGDHTSISAAIAASGDGDRIEVSAGTYGESIDFLGKSITVTGTAGPLFTIITGDGEQTVRMDSGEGGDTLLDGFTIQGADHTCIWLEDTSPSMENLIIQDCGVIGSSTGGGLRVTSGSPQFSNVQFIGNVGETGGGVWIGDEADLTLDGCSFTSNSAGTGGGIACIDSSLTLNDTDFTNNAALDSNGGAISTVDCMLDVTEGAMEGNVAFTSGGAVFTSGGTVNLSAISSIARNSATYGYGGGLALSGSDDVLISNVLLRENQAWNGGGALRLANALTTLISGTQFESNEALNDEANGGAIEALSGDLNILDSSFSHNLSGTNGGALFAAGTDVSGDELVLEHNSTLGNGGGLAISLGNLVLTSSVLERNEGLSGGGGLFLNRSDASVTDTVFEWNESNGGEGGAIKIIESDVTLSRLLLNGNHAQNGGGLYSEDADSIDWSASVVQENEALFESGGALIQGSGSTSMWNNDFIGNEVFSSGGNAQLKVQTEHVDIRNNLIAWGINGSGLSLNPISAEAPIVRHNDVWANESLNYLGITDPTGTAGNISVDPQIVEITFDLDFDNDDLYLLHDSPCLGAGDPEWEVPGAPFNDIGARGLTERPILDEDGDGFGPDPGGDCNDADPTVNPDATELCDDTIDNNCDGSVNEGCEEDTGWVEPEEPKDTGGPSTDPDPPEDDRTGGNDANQPTQGGPYEIEGKGCRCSASSTDPTWVWLTLFPLIVSRRRRT